MLRPDTRYPRRGCDEAAVVSDGSVIRHPGTEMVLAVNTGGTLPERKKAGAYRCSHSSEERPR